MPLHEGLFAHPSLPLRIISFWVEDFLKTEKSDINGNRKTDILRELEDMGFKKCCPWYTEAV